MLQIGWKWQQKVGAPYCSQRLPTRNGNQGLLIITFILNYFCYHYIFQDSQKKKNIERFTLDMMTSDNLYRIALIALYGEVGLMDLRKWDVKGRDLAEEMSDGRAFM